MWESHHKYLPRCSNYTGCQATITIAKDKEGPELDFVCEQLEKHLGDPEILQCLLGMKQLPLVGSIVHARNPERLTVFFSVPPSSVTHFDQGITKKCTQKTKHRLRKTLKVYSSELLDFLPAQCHGVSSLVSEVKLARGLS